MLVLVCWFHVVFMLICCMFSVDLGIVILSTVMTIGKCLERLSLMHYVNVVGTDVI